MRNFFNNHCRRSVSCGMKDRFEESMVALKMSPRAKRFIEEDTTPSQIENGLYLGSLGAANTRTTLKRLNVTHILTLKSSRAQFYPRDFVYKTILVHDRANVDIRSYFNECFAFIDEARARGGCVLVHCTAGISRSVSVVVAYLMFKNGTSFSKAMRYVKLKRAVASPNVGFRRQLQEYEISLSTLRGNKECSHRGNKLVSDEPCKQTNSGPKAHFPFKRIQAIPSLFF